MPTPGPLDRDLPRDPIERRPGTRLDHRFTVPIMYQGKPHGLLETRHRVWQHGGQRKNFVLQRMQAITFPEPVWLDLKNQIDYLEMVDHVDHVVYQVGVKDADAKGWRYVDAKIGPRYAVPVSAWSVFDTEGNPV